MDNLENKNTELQENEGQEQSTNNAYTKEEVDLLLQRESDRRVSQALAKQKKDYEKKLSLVNLDEQQRAAAEKDMRIAELQEQLKEYAIERNKSELKTVLGNRGLSPAFADIIAIGDDLDEAQERIDTLDKLFKAAVAEEVKKRLAGGTPKVGSVGSGDITPEQFRKLNLVQQNELYNTNRELYEKLTK